jgi:hypothetical protein
MALSFDSLKINPVNKSSFMNKNFPVSLQNAYNLSTLQKLIDVLKKFKSWQIKAKLSN